ncbi:MAG: type II toxin-antitoxin system mRNA interferase toxin, RelE/StbE family [Spirochaetales bacterium]|nr:type II toxin-antitoxin system mRNA interferase toxin, RelE/StbE family [Spirochaetales bacterium]
MKEFEIKITNQALKDIKKLNPKLKEKLKAILVELLSKNPYLGKPLLGDLKGNYSYRLTLKDRIVYSIDEDKKIIYIKRARTHYGE